MSNAKAGDRFVAFKEGSVWPSLKLGCLASHSPLHHVDHLESVM